MAMRDTGGSAASGWMNPRVALRGPMRAGQMNPHLASRGQSDYVAVMREEGLTSSWNRAKVRGDDAEEGR